jgi:hypothetical protein
MKVDGGGDGHRLEVSPVILSHEHMPVVEQYAGGMPAASSKIPRSSQARLRWSDDDGVRSAL